MASKIIEKLSKEKEVLNAFIAWYKANYDSKLPILTFFTLPFEFQLGILINFFEENYNYSLHADRESYLVFYPDIDKVRDIILNRKGKLLDVDNFEFVDFNSLMRKVIYNYERGMIKILELIVNPF